ncbi:MAG TPA: DNA primase [Patescibacteria group bacterium]
MADQIEEIKQKTDIVAIIGEHVVLKKAGSNFKGLCPFHSEKSPSFMVSPELQIYKCFGCGEGGDVFSFLEKQEGMDFGEALKYLADRAGIKLERSSFQDKSGKEVLYELNALAAKFYNFLLTKHKIGTDALAYLSEKRGLKKETIETFNLGFAPNNPSTLFNFLVNKKKFKPADVEKAGLAIKVRGSYLDRFRGRAIFPILDYRGNTLALAGRILPNYERPDSAKYINSPETPIYHKGATLYGLNITRPDIKKSGTALIVEGELDLISSWQIGIRNVVAIKGSAVTADQGRILSRFAKEVVLALDSDFAGGEAARRGITILNEFGFDIKVLRLTKYKDPDDAARADPAGYKDALKKTIGIWDFLLDLVFSKHEGKEDADVAKISREVTPILASIPDKIVQAHYIDLVAKRLDIPDEAVVEELVRHTPKEANDAKKDEKTLPVPEVEKSKTRRELIEERFASLIFQYDPHIFQNEEISSFFTTPLIKRIVQEASLFLSSHSEFNLKSFSESLPVELFEGFGVLVFKGVEDGVDCQKELKLTFKELFTLDTKQRLKKVLRRIAENNDPKAQKEYENLSAKLKGFKDVDFERIIGKTK